MLISRLAPLVALILPWQNAQAESEDIKPDGAFWVRTTTGSGGAPQSSTLRIRTSGRLILRGSARSEVSYRRTERVRARSEAEARALFGIAHSLALQPASIATWFVGPLSSMVSSELQVEVPKAVTNVILETRLGDIEAYDFEGDLRADTSAGTIHAERIGGSVIGRTGGGEIRLGQVGGSIRCLSGGGSISIGNAGGEVNCQTAGGDIEVLAARGPLALATEGGNIHVDKAAGSVEAHSGAGLIDIGEAGGLVVADTRGGSIQVGSARGVRCESAAGAIRVKTSSGPLNVTTAMGSVVAQVLAATRLEDSSLVAGDGDVTVLIPSNLALSITARNDSREHPRIVSDFSELRTNRIGFLPASLVAEGGINGGGPMMRISAAGGAIYLRRIKSEK